MNVPPPQIETLLRPDLEPNPELLDEIRRFMAEFERKLRSECCRNALAAKKLRQSEGERVAPLLAPEQVGGGVGDVCVRGGRVGVCEGGVEVVWVWG